MNKIENTRNTTNHPPIGAADLSRIDIYGFLRGILFLSYIIYTFQNIGIILPQIKPYYVLFSVIILVCVYHIMWLGDLSNLIKSVRFYGIFILLWLWSMMSVAWSISPAQSLQHGIKLGMFCIMSVAVTTMFAARSRQCAATIITALAVNFIITASGFLYIFFAEGGAAIIASGSMTAYINYMANITFGFTGGKNLLSSWAAFQLTFTVPLLWKYLNRRLLAKLTALACCAVLCLTISRIALYCVAVFLFFGCFKLEIKTRMRIFTTLFFCVIILLAVFETNTPGYLNKYYERIASPIKIILDSRFNINDIRHQQDLTEQVDRGVYGRIVLWQIAARSLQEHSLITGSGAGTVYGKGIDNEDNYHNQPLQFLVQMGIPGFILFVLWNVRLFIRTLKTYRHSTGNLKFITWIVLINFIIYSLKGLFMAQYLDLEIWTIIIFISLFADGLNDRTANE